MIRFCRLIVVVVIASVLIRMFARHDESTPAVPVISQASATVDPAIALRTLDGTTRPSKAWVSDFAGFVSANPGRWVVGHCANPCLSEAEAAEESRKDAANSVWTIVAASSGPLSDSDRLRKRVIADVVAGRLDADHLAEQFQRPYGTVWTESVLLDASQSRLDAMLESYKSDEARWHRHEIQIRRTVLVAVAGSWFMYLFLNAVTKGYFTLRLRLAAMLVTAVGVAMLV